MAPIVYNKPRGWHLHIIQETNHNNGLNIQPVCFLGSPPEIFANCCWNKSMCRFQFCDADMMLTMPTLTYFPSSVEIQLKQSEAALSPLIWRMKPTSCVTGHISSLRTRRICSTLLIYVLEHTRRFLLLFRQTSTRPDTCRVDQFI